MLHFLPAPIKGLLTLLLCILSTLFWCLLLLPVGALRWLAPVRVKRPLTDLMSTIANNWIFCNNLILDLFQDISIDLNCPDEFSTESWYLVVCNHQSWVDILILQRIFLHRLPMLKFFIKHQLIWVPVLGLAWWALDFPFMKRFSAAQLRKNPALRAVDLNTTRSACEVFKTAPVAALNFLEGTRFTEMKHHNQSSPFTHLLKPRSGGAALVIQVMKNEIKLLVDVTIVYKGQVPGLWDFFCGHGNDMAVVVNVHEIPEQLALGDYQEDVEFKDHFQRWINDIWTQKDQLIKDYQANV